MGQLRLVGINIKSLPLLLCERFILSNKNIENAPILLKNIFNLSEIVCIFIHNRIEYYYTSEMEVDPYALICYFCRNDVGLSKLIRAHIYCFSGHKVINQLSLVTGRLKSIGFGCDGDFNQLKNGFQVFVRNGCSPKELINLCHYAFKRTN